MSGGELSIGTRVRFWPGRRDCAANCSCQPGRVSRTRSLPWHLGDGTKVVAVEGYAGGIAMTHVEVLHEEVTA